MNFVKYFVFFVFFGFPKPSKNKLKSRICCKTQWIWSKTWFFLCFFAFGYQNLVVWGVQPSPWPPSPNPTTIPWPLDMGLTTTNINTNTNTNTNTNIDFLIKINHFPKESLPQSSPQRRFPSGGALEEDSLFKMNDFLKVKSNDFLPHRKLILGGVIKEDSLFKSMVSLWNPCPTAPHRGDFSEEELLERIPYQNQWFP